MHALLRNATAIGPGKAGIRHCADHSSQCRHTSQCTGALIIPHLLSTTLRHPVQRSQAALMTNSDSHQCIAPQNIRPRSAVGSCCSLLLQRHLRPRRAEVAGCTSPSLRILTWKGVKEVASIHGARLRHREQCQVLIASKGCSCRGLSGSAALGQALALASRCVGLHAQPHSRPWGPKPVPGLVQQWQWRREGLLVILVDDFELHRKDRESRTQSGECPDLSRKGTATIAPSETCSTKIPLDDPWDRQR